MRRSLSSTFTPSCFFNFSFCSRSFSLRTASASFLSFSSSACWSWMAAKYGVGRPRESEHEGKPLAAEPLVGGVCLCCWRKAPLATLWRGGFLLRPVKRLDECSEERYSEWRVRLAPAGGSRQEGT